MVNGPQLNGTVPKSKDQDMSTTTLSTIAVRAGEHASIVVALLKSVGFLELRIDEMKPGVLEIGEGARETANLLSIHDDLLKRLAVGFRIFLGSRQLKVFRFSQPVDLSTFLAFTFPPAGFQDKEDQVTALLTRTENLSSEKEAREAIVYEDMATCLKEAWRGLQKQLVLRGYLLRETLTFHRLVEHHERVVDETTKALQISMRTENGHDAASASKKTDQLMNEAVSTKPTLDLIDTTAEAMDVGSSVIAQIRALGPIADNPERDQQMLASCVLIEKNMLR
ncbi:unnamed protein product [Heligmosomoides polygyrus]|uniref:V-type proton ATPase subunit a n=1 Tax=Heligmosomoides polygyrus TaxID=6339 RepID=A0A183FKQ2_HELPZ|nr:unnamed protein product [Heligmosomoides polygyrus]